MCIISLKIGDDMTKRTANYISVSTAFNLAVKNIYL